VTCAGSRELKTTVQPALTAHQTCLGTIEREIATTCHLRSFMGTMGKYPFEGGFGYNLRKSMIETVYGSQEFEHESSILAQERLSKITRFSSHSWVFLSILCHF
jgi:hypothetical protein